MSRQSGTLGGTCRPPHRFKVLVAAKQIPVRSIRERGTGVRAWPIWKVPDWPIWKLPPWLLAFVVTVVLADAVVLRLGGSGVPFRAHALAPFAAVGLARSPAAPTIWRCSPGCSPAALPRSSGPGARARTTAW